MIGEQHLGVLEFSRPIPDGNDRNWGQRTRKSEENSVKIGGVYYQGFGKDPDAMQMGGTVYGCNRSAM